MSAEVVIVEVLGQPCALPLSTVREGFERARGLAPAPQVSAAAVEPLLDADASGALLGVHARWLEDMARAGIVPHYKLGRFVRFRVSEVAAAVKVSGAAVPGTDAAATDYLSVGRVSGQSNQRVRRVSPVKSPGNSGRDAQPEGRS